MCGASWKLPVGKTANRILHVKIDACHLSRPPETVYTTEYQPNNNYLCQSCVRTDCVSCRVHIAVSCRERCIFLFDLQTACLTRIRTMNALNPLKAFRATVSGPKGARRGGAINAQQVELRVGGMTCGHCTAAVEKALQVMSFK